MTISAVRWRNLTMSKEQGRRVKKESRSPDRGPDSSKKDKSMVTQASMEIKKKVKKVVDRWIPLQRKNMRS